MEKVHIILNQINITSIRSVKICNFLSPWRQPQVATPLLGNWNSRAINGKVYLQKFSGYDPYNAWPFLSVDHYFCKTPDHWVLYSCMKLMRVYTMI